MRNFSRYHKPVLSSAQRECIEGYSIGEDLRGGARRVLKLIVRANARREKSPVLLQIREEVEELKVLPRLCQDGKAFANFNSFEHAMRLTTDIARQNEGWLKSQRQGRGPAGAGPTGAGQNRRVMFDELAAPSVPPSIRALEMEMRAGRQPDIPYVADQLSSADRRANSHARHEAAFVGVASHYVEVEVLDVNVPTIAGPGSGVAHHAFGGRTNGGPLRCA